MTEKLEIKGILSEISEWELRGLFNCCRCEVTNRAWNFL